MSDRGDTRMKDTPMLDSDRENMRLEFEGFDDMTLDEFDAASKRRLDELLDLYNELGDS